MCINMGENNAPFSGYLFDKTLPLSGSLRLGLAFHFEGIYSTTALSDSGCQIIAHLHIDLNLIMLIHLQMLLI